MAKFLIEGTELNFEEKVTVEDEKQTMKPNELIVERVERITFKSPIYTYEKDKSNVLIKKLKRFGEDYYKIVIFSPEQDKAWGINEISSKLDITVRRLDSDNILIVGENKTKEHLISQITFCSLKPSMSVEEVTINFTILDALKFYSKSGVLVGVQEQDFSNDSNLHMLSLYSFEGKLIKNFYEYYDTEEYEYTASITDKKITIEKINKKDNKKESQEFLVAELLKKK